MAFRWFSVFYTCHLIIFSKLIEVYLGEVADSKSMEVIDKIDDLGSKTGTPLVDKIEIVQCGLVGT
jgi:hypothetical protein